MISEIWDVLKRPECDETMVSIRAMTAGPYDYQAGRAQLACTGDITAFAVDVYPHYGSDVDAALKAGYDMKNTV